MCADAVDLGHQVLHGELFLGDEEDFVLGEKTKNKNQSVSQSVNIFM